MILCTLFSLISIFQYQIEGEYYLKKNVKNTGGSLKHFSSIKLKSDKSYIYIDAAFSKSGQLISSDTIQGEWRTVGDTLFTKNYNSKWLIKRNSLIKLSVTKLNYYKKK